MESRFRDVLDSQDVVALVRHGLHEVFRGIIGTRSIARPEGDHGAGSFLEGCQSLVGGRSVFWWKHRCAGFAGFARLGDCAKRP